jgi:hypothetical protein
MTFFSVDDDEVPQDARDVLAASAILQITEFRLFELAYLHWFGTSVCESHIERYYTGYMFASRAPFWVRQYCRDVLERNDENRLDPREFGVYPRQESDTMAKRGMRLGLILLFLMTTLHLVAILVSKY